MKEEFPICAVHHCHFNIKKLKYDYTVTCPASTEHYLISEIICPYCYSPLYIYKDSNDYVREFCSNPKCGLFSINFYGRTCDSMTILWNKNYIYEGYCYDSKLYANQERIYKLDHYKKFNFHIETNRFIRNMLLYRNIKSF